MRPSAALGQSPASVASFLPAVGEVGTMSGWLDANYFSRCFRKHFGMTPSRYRARFMDGQKLPQVARAGTPIPVKRELARPK
jgi:AraC-like DNA-binding protein